MTFKATLINGEARARHSGRETIDVSLELNSTHKRQKRVWFHSTSTVAERGGILVPIYSHRRQGQYNGHNETQEQ